MEKVARRSHLRQFAFLLIIIIEFSLLLSVSSQEIPSRNHDTADNSPPAVQLDTRHHTVTVDNGLFQVTFEKPSGYLIGIKYKGLDNVLEWRNKRTGRGYWDVVWGDDGLFDKMETQHFNVITQTDDNVELSFSKTWNSHDRSVPLNIDKRFVIRRGVPGIHMYAILERQEDFPSTYMSQMRLVFKLLREFNFMALSDSRQTIMPSENERKHSPNLGFKEAVVLSNNTNDPQLRGQVDDKYQFSYENKDNKLHGWIADSDKLNPAVGFWLITPSNEFRNGGPHKQELTSHVGPTALVMFASTHYVGREMDTHYEQGKPWKKVLGPVFIYLNSALLTKIQMSARHYGKMLKDRYMKQDHGHTMHAHSAFVGLAPPGAAGSWQTDTKGYQFWTQTDKHGRFEIKHVQPGDYNLYAWVPGFIGDYKLNLNITIQPGKEIDLGALIYDPPRNGPTLWEIGIPDRTAAEFFIPDPYPTRMNRICKDPVDRFDSTMHFLVGLIFQRT
ncbi:hypothetical protein COLO4_20518 [Corchorus olitorius]|uniref:Rhamnogalacturonan lyase domain-containing protein n=1 Tax=Corchorus olitorius TaxID=93759 RepID=A0A1R3IZD7_9ROSI|nr:hypothetical protein COLO4_20518 [Corchorus olitorius]